MSLKLTRTCRTKHECGCYTHTLMPVYHCHKPVFRPKMAIFWRAGMREGGLSLPLAFQYLIFMIRRACDLNLVIISLLASKCQDFELRGLQFHSIKQLKNSHSNFRSKNEIFYTFLHMTVMHSNFRLEWVNWNIFSINFYLRIT